MGGSQALQSIEKVRRSDACYMLGGTMKLEIDGLVKNVRSLSLGTPLTSVQVSKYGAFYQKASNRMAYFLMPDATPCQKGEQPQGYFRPGGCAVHPRKSPARYKGWESRGPGLP